jgi:type VI secretion system protein ImpA
VAALLVGGAPARMRYDRLFEPVSEAEPCGPDLDEAGDDGYLNYVLAVSSRLPERFFRGDKPFDRNEIKLKEEVDTIGGLLDRTRDLRLLAIEARFQSFAGELPGLADCLEAAAGLVVKFWADVHPKALEGDFTLRQNTLSGLDDFSQIIQPLQYAPLVRDRRLGAVTYRQFAVASGAAEKRADETAPEVGEIQRSIASDENRAMSDSSYDAVVRAAAALPKMREAFIENSGYDYVPSFDRLSAFLAQALELFRASRPELVATAAQPEALQGDAAAEGGGGEAAAQPRAAALTGMVKSHAGAAAALLAVEEYFAAREPSTPALILVHQARSLVGKPLIHALEILLPDAAPRAMIKIQSEINVQLNMAQLKQLTNEMPKLANGANGSETGSETFTAASRAEAMTLIAEVEHFFKVAEPSSPVPMLLTKASGYSNRDFNAILKDLIAPVPEGPPEKKK